jgi:hypothetical protein
LEDFNLLKESTESQFEEESQKQSEMELEHSIRKDSAANPEINQEIDYQLFSVN